MHPAQLDPNKLVGHLQCLPTAALWLYALHGMDTEALTV